MIPDVATVLSGIARAVMMDIAAEPPSPYSQLTVQLVSALLMMIAQEHERAAARLVEENEALRTLLADAVPLVNDADLRERLSERGTETSLHLSALRARNRKLRALLIDLHAHIEQLDSTAARALDARIWAELAASTRRRQLDLANG